MTPKTKKYLVIGGVVVGAAAIWYFFLRKKGGAAIEAKTIKVGTANAKERMKKAIKKTIVARKGKPVELNPTAEQQ